MRLLSIVALALVKTTVATLYIKTMSMMDGGTEVVWAQIEDNGVQQLCAGASGYNSAGFNGGDFHLEFKFDRNNHYAPHSYNIIKHSTQQSWDLTCSNCRDEDYPYSTACNISNGCIDYGGEMNICVCRFFVDKTMGAHNCQPHSGNSVKIESELWNSFG